MYHVLNAEYGQVLFERDQAQRILQIANFQRRSVLKQRTKNRTYDMDFFSIFDKSSFSSLYLPTSILILTTTNVKLTPPEYSPLFAMVHTEDAKLSRGHHENGMFSKEHLLRFVFRL